MMLSREPFKFRAEKQVSKDFKLFRKFDETAAGVYHTIRRSFYTKKHLDVVVSMTWRQNKRNSRRNYFCFVFASLGMNEHQTFFV
jgi:tryptophanase